MTSMKAEWSQLNCSRALEMLQNGEGGDFVVEVRQKDGQQNKEFRVHKFVLMLNSDVFKAMFSHESTKECREDRVQITDSTPIAVHQMLTYMYTGTLPKDYDVKKDAAALIAIADKYQIKPLKDFNEHKLIESLSPENAFHRLKLADLYQTNSLKFACGKLIHTQLKHAVGWTSLKKNSPKMAFYVLEECYDSTNTGQNQKLKKLKRRTKWAELKKKSPELAFFVLEECGYTSKACQHCGNWQ